MIQPEYAPLRHLETRSDARLLSAVLEVYDNANSHRWRKKQLNRLQDALKERGISVDVNDEFSVREKITEIRREARERHLDAVMSRFKELSVDDYEY